MKRIATLFCATLCFAASGAFAQGVSGGGPTKTMATLQMPAAPDPVAVAVEPSTTAVIVNDILVRNCNPHPVCANQMAPAIAKLLAKARRAGVYVVYTTPPSGGVVLPIIAPKAGDPVISGSGQDRFYKTKLDDLLKTKGVTTVILVGWHIDGTILYTSVGATLRGYTVVVPEDTSLAATDYDIAIGRYQLLTQNSSNVTNAPLKSKASTLSRSDLISFK
jgi:nicotinamidase-related amidase